MARLSREETSELHRRRKAQMVNALLASMAYRHELGHPERMGSHDMEAAANRGVPTRDLKLVTVQAWTVMDKTHVTCFGTYYREEGPISRNLGADLLDYRLLELPSLGQIVWCLGDEIRHAWRELSSPKDSPIPPPAA